MSALLTGQMIGNIRLDNLLADDARVFVYRGHHTTLSIDVAVKILKPERQQSQPAFYYDFFRREAQIAARLDDHPNIVRVLDFGQHEALPYLVMEIVDGFPLHEYIRRHRAPLGEAKTLKILLATATALGEVYATGICPCELKPSNLFITRAGQLKIAALRPTGFARIPSTDGSAHGEAPEATKIILATDATDLPLGPRIVTLSVDRVTVGAVAYMAPESFRPDGSVDHRSDLYTLGVIAYRAAFGHLPYVGSLLQIINGHLRGDASFTGPTPCRAPAVKLIQKMMAVNPEARYDSVQALMQDTRMVLRTMQNQPASDQNEPATAAPQTENPSLMDIASSMERRFDDIPKMSPEDVASSTQFIKHSLASRKTP